MKKDSLITRSFVFLLLFGLLANIVFAQELKDLKEAPSFSLRRVSFGDSSQVSLSSYEGRIVLLLFFARWDTSSVNQVPVVQKVADSFTEVTALAINTSLDADNNLTRFENQMGMNYPVLASDGQVTRKYGVGQALPVVCMISSDQKLYKKYTGNVPANRLEKDIETLIEEELKMAEEKKRKQETELS